MSNKAICTVVTKSHLAYAQTLADSFLTYYPKGNVFVLIIDPSHEYELSRDPRIKFISFDEVAKWDGSIIGLAFKYTALELCCAMKAYFIDFLLKKHKLKNIIYFDSDILITNRIESIFKLFKENSILLTPHILDPHNNTLTGPLGPNFISILSTGVFNLGFIGVSRSFQGLNFLNWWKIKVSEECKSDIRNGYFLDQKIVDLAPGLFSKIGIIREAGANVGFWNLHERKLQKKGNKYFVNHQPLLFFHFSGYNFRNPKKLSSNQNRHQFRDYPCLKPLFENYRKLLLKNKAQKFSLLSYGHAKFDTGIVIPPLVQELYGKLFAKISVRHFLNPFETKGDHSFFNWLIGKNAKGVAPLILEMRALREDVSRHYKYPGTHHDEVELVKWAIVHGCKEFELPNIWTRLLLLSQMDLFSESKKNFSSALKLRPQGKLMGQKATF